MPKTLASTLLALAAVAAACGGEAPNASPAAARRLSLTYFTMKG